jgi:hypothetical protein
MLLFGQLGSVVPYVENNDTFWSNVFQAYMTNFIILLLKGKHRKTTIDACWAYFFAIRMLRLKIKLYSTTVQDMDFWKLSYTLQLQIVQDMDFKKEVCFVRNFVDANGIYLSCGCTEFK